ELLDLDAGRLDDHDRSNHLHEGCTVRRRRSPVTTTTSRIPTTAPATGATGTPPLSADTPRRSATARTACSAAVAKSTRDFESGASVRSRCWSAPVGVSFSHGSTYPSSRTIGTQR